MNRPTSSDPPSTTDLAVQLYREDGRAQRRSIFVGLAVVAVFGASAAIAKHRVGGFDLEIVLRAGSTIAFGLTVGVGVLRTRALALVRGAANEIARGRFDVARALLRRGRRGAWWAGRAIAARAAELALATGEVEDAVREMDRALGRARGTWDFMPAARIAAHALRAVAHALVGDGPKALADVTAARDLVARGEFGRVLVGERHARSILSRLALAESLVAAFESGRDASADRESQQAALALKLDAAESVVLEGATPRERALFRSLYRLVEARRASAYREPPKSDAPAPELSMRAWIARVMPEAAPFAEPGEERADPLPPYTPEPFRHPEQGPAFDLDKELRRWIRRILIGVGAIVGFIVAVSLGFYLLDMFLGRRESGRAMGAILLGLTGAVASGAVILTWARAAAHRDAVRRFHETLFVVATTPKSELPELDAVQKRIPALVVAYAAARARAALVRGDLDEAHAFAQAGFEVARKKELVGKGFDEVNELSTVFALVFAALGEPADARGYLYTTPPVFDRWAAAQLEVELVLALRQNRSAFALRIASAATQEMPLDWRVEVLVDVVRARKREGGVVPTVLGRLRRDLRAPRVRPFARKVAAWLVEDVEHAGG